jgi:hypothetical protein
MQSLLVNRLTWGFVISYTAEWLGLVSQNQSNPLSFTREKDLCWCAVLMVCVTGTVDTNIR